MVHNFNVYFAEKYGIEGAILIECIYGWLRRNVCNDEVIKEGRVWCYLSAKGFNRYIPYMNPKKIYRELQKLEGNVLLVGNFNDRPLNQTLWYSFTDEFLAELNEHDYKVSDFPKMENAFSKNEKSNNNIINYTIIENNKKESKSLSNDKQKSDESFKILWSKYKKGSKQNAINQWNKLKDKEKKLVLNTVDDYITYCRRSNRPLKDVSAYLHQKCFNDDWNVIPEYYIIREGDDARCQRFKGWMCSTFKDLLYHRNPLTYEQAQELFDEYPVSSIRIAMEKLSSRDIHQYYNIKSGIEKILESDEL